MNIYFVGMINCFPEIHFVRASLRVILLLFWSTRLAISPSTSKTRKRQLAKKIPRSLGQAILSPLPSEATGRLWEGRAPFKIVTQGLLAGLILLDIPEGFPPDSVHFGKGWVHFRREWEYKRLMVNLVQVVGGSTKKSTCVSLPSLFAKLWVNAMCMHHLLNREFGYSVKIGITPR